MAELPHRCNGHDFEQAQGVGAGQGSLACCSPSGGKESDTTEQLNNNDIHLNASIQASAALRSLFDLPGGLTVDDFRYHPRPDKARSSALLVIFCCCFSVTKSCQTLHNTMTAARQPCLSFIISWSLLKFMSMPWLES